MKVRNAERFLWNCSVAKLEREKANMQTHNERDGLLIDPRALRTSEAPEDAGVYRLSHAI